LVTKYPLTNKEFDTIFQRFNKEVYAGNYSKMDYQDWKLFTRSIAENKDFCLIFLLKTQTVQVFINRAFMIYKEDDGSFGTFLFNNVDTIIENNNTTNEKENNTMNFNFDFSPVNPSLVRMSMYGLAVKNKSGTWVSYNPNSDEIVDVDVLNFDGAKFLYRMPVAIKDIAVGDVVVHNGAPMFVVFVPQDGKTLTVVDTVNGERKDIMLPRSPFGFNFATKVVNFMGNMMASANEDNPFGNMWMLMAMSDEGEGKDMNDMLPFLMMNNATDGMDKNMMMFMALSKSEGGNKDMLLWWLMSQNMNAAPAHECKCGGNCGNHQPQN
jgi:hypothetical protein